LLTLFFSDGVNVARGPVTSFPFDRESKLHSLKVTWKCSAMRTNGAREQNYTVQERLGLLYVIKLEISASSTRESQISRTNPLGFEDFPKIINFIKVISNIIPVRCH
jgi:hypothetical protein